MKDSFKIGFGIYLGFVLAQSIDNAFKISNKLTNILGRIKNTEETK